MQRPTLGRDARARPVGRAVGSAELLVRRPLHVADRRRRTLPGEDPALECWTVLTALGALVPRLRLVSMVSPVTIHHPVVLAKRVATLDLIAPGRVVLGLGAGWQINEHDAYGFELPAPGPRSIGSPRRSRWCTCCCTRSARNFSGQYYNLTDATFVPRPDHAAAAGRHGGAAHAAPDRSVRRRVEHVGRPRSGARAHGRVHDGVRAGRPRPVDRPPSAQAMIFLTEDDATARQVEGAGAGGRVTGRRRQRADRPARRRTSSWASTSSPSPTSRSGQRPRPAARSSRRLRTEVLPAIDADRASGAPGSDQGPQRGGAVVEAGGGDPLEVLVQTLARGPNTTAGVPAWTCSAASVQYGAATTTAGPPPTPSSAAASACTSGDRRRRPWAAGSTTTSMTTVVSPAADSTAATTAATCSSGPSAVVRSSTVSSHLAGTLNVSPLAEHAADQSADGRVTGVAPPATTARRPPATAVTGARRGVHGVGAALGSRRVRRATLERPPSTTANPRWRATICRSVGSSTTAASADHSADQCLGADAGVLLVGDRGDDDVAGQLARSHGRRCQQRAGQAALGVEHPAAAAGDHRPSRRASCSSLLTPTVSMWPLNKIDRPPPLPRLTATTFHRPGGHLGALHLETAIGAPPLDERRDRALRPRRRARGRGSPSRSVPAPRSGRPDGRAHRAAINQLSHA